MVPSIVLLIFVISVSGTIQNKRALPLNANGESDLTSFAGQCRYGDDKKNYIGNSQEPSVSDCQKACENEDGCTAFTFKSTGWCFKYRGGPYTHGDGRTGNTCYVMPGSSCINASSDGFCKWSKKQGYCTTQESTQENCKMTCGLCDSA